MPRRLAKDYAQERRDQEVSARIELKRAIPDELFTGQLAENDKTFSISAKIMMAATECIRSLLQQNAATTAVGRLKESETVSIMSLSLSLSLSSRDPHLAMLRQAMLRCVQIAEEKACEADGSVNGELRDIVERGYDLLVDLNDMLQQGCMTEKQRIKWVQEQEAWGKGFYLQK